MAVSPAHKLGQIIGEQFEAAVRQPLIALTKEYDLYLDYTHIRPARGNKKKVSWEDSQGNTHDLDYVIEEGGTETKRGHPRAFIETAWRRYTKHSRNKAQEIQGAVVPVAEKYKDYSPFLGAALAGTFTDGSLEQLKSHGFQVAYCGYDVIVQAFHQAGIDIAFDESTSEAELQRKVDAFEEMETSNRDLIPEEILKANKTTFNSFFSALQSCFERSISHIYIFTLSGRSHEFISIDKAVNFISTYNESTSTSEFIRYEIIARYSNGDEVRGEFKNRDRAISFLLKLNIA